MRPMRFLPCLDENRPGSTGEPGPGRILPAALGLFLLAFGLQVLFALGGIFLSEDWACLYGDSWILHSMAVNHIRSGMFSYQEAHPTLTQLPAYPWLVSLSYRLCGQDPRIVLWVQMVLSSLAVPVVWVASRPLLGRYGLLLAVLFALDLHRLLYSAWLLSEFPVWLLWTGALLLLLHAERRPGLFVPAFGLLGLAALMKPLAGYAPAFLVLGWAALSPRSLWRNRRPVAWGLLLLVVLLAPLLLRNWRLTGEFPRYSTIGSFNSMYFNAAYYEMGARGLSLAEARCAQVEKMRRHLNGEKGAAIPPIPPEVALDRHRHMEALGLDEYAYCRMCDVLFGRFLRDNWPGYLAAHLRSGLEIFTVSTLGCLKVFHGEFRDFSFSAGGLGGALARFRHPDLGTWFLLVRAWELAAVPLLLLLAATGLVLAWRRSLEEPAVLLSVLVLAYMVAACGVNTWGRFRFLLMPFLLFLAVRGLTVLAGRLQCRTCAPPSRPPSRPPS